MRRLNLFQRISKLLYIRRYAIHPCKFDHETIVRWVFYNLCVTSGQRNCSFSYHLNCRCLLSTQFCQKSFFLKQTTNTSRTRIDSIKYKVDINTMEHLSVENGRLAKEDVPMQLNQIAHVVLTSSKELFFDPYTKNKATGAFILIDPITNNTSAVGMIIDQVADKDMHNQMELPVLNLPKLGIAPEHYEAIERAVKELERQGIAVEIKK